MYRHPVPLLAGLLLLAMLIPASCRIFHSRPESRIHQDPFFNGNKAVSAPEDGNPPEESSIPPVKKTQKFGDSVEGRPIVGTLLGEGDEATVLVGGIHGDAPGGEILLQGLIEAIGSDPGMAAHRRLLILPSCNPDGLEAEKRRNANNVDLNLDFPDSDVDAEEASSAQPETRALLEALAANPPSMAVIIQSPSGCVDYEGPDAKALALRASRASRLPLCKRETPPGSLAFYIGKVLKAPVIIIELDYRHKRGLISPVEKERLINTLLDLLEMD